MSHLSQIKTRINNTQILQKTLEDLGFKYILKNTNKLDIYVINKTFDNFEFVWNGKEYLLVADLQLWKNKFDIEQLINKITQQYSYNAIIQESIKYGFSNCKTTLMQDGAIKLVIQRWK